MQSLRTNIEIDPKSLQLAKKTTGIRTTKEVVDFALKRLAKSAKALDELLGLSGKVRFQKRYSYKKSRG